MQVTPDSFAAFYALYPRHVARKAAEKAWVRVATSPEIIDQIMAGLRAQLPAMLKTYPKNFVPHPGTWLNQERWRDETSSLRQLSVNICVLCGGTQQVLVGPPVLEIRRCSCHPLVGETLQAIHPEDWREYQRVLSACVGSAR